MKLQPRAAAAAEPATQIPVQKPQPKKSTKSARARARKAKQVSTGDKLASEGHDLRLRWAAFNASAAAAGHLAIWSVTGDPMAGAAFMARMTISVPELAATGITFGAAVACWKGATLIHLHRLPGSAGRAARPLAALGGALWGQGTAPVVRDVLDAIEPWGTTLAPLLAAGPAAAACWWAMDRRLRQAAPLVRWFARVPLSTVALSALLYAPGAAL